MQDLVGMPETTRDSALISREPRSAVVDSQISALSRVLFRQNSGTHFIYGEAQLYSAKAPDAPVYEPHERQRAHDAEGR